MLPTHKFLQALQSEVEQTRYGEYPPELYDPIRYLMALNGKRLRPQLTLFAASLFTDNWTEAIKPALAVEVFHNFTLMHDDIMDKAPLRRGKPTVHTRWNENTAILSGDVMLVQAYELLLHVPQAQLAKAISRFNKTAAEVCEGQQLDMNFENRADVTIPEYINMIRLKTSVLLGFALELGGLVGGADEESRRLLYEGGVNLGIGFQLKDDLLDVYGDPEKFGKQVGGDILSNKKTFLYLKTLELADPSGAELLRNYFTGAPLPPQEKVAAVTALYDQYETQRATEAFIRSYFSAGQEALNRLPVDKTKKEQLLEFVRHLIEREK